jgi:hypothetical protein
MSHWESKNADTLADAISKHIRSHPDAVEDNALLAIIGGCPEFCVNGG